MATPLIYLKDAKALKVYGTNPQFPIVLKATFDEIGEVRILFEEDQFIQLIERGQRILAQRLLQAAVPEDDAAKDQEESSK